MGRKKQKVRWTSVEDAGFFETDVTESNNQEVLSSNPEGGIMQQKTNHTGSDSTGNYVRFYNKKSFTSENANRLKRSSSGSSGGFYASLPPRFERVASAANQAKMMYQEQYELDSNCETEELPNGFTKIRSKNLDVLFRKDYYAQRMLSTASSSAVSSEQGEPTPDEDPEVITICEPPVVLEEDENEIENDQNDNNTELGKGSDEPKEEGGNVNNDNTNKSSETEEVKNLDQIKSSKINSNALPFYPSSYVPPVHPPQSFNVSTTVSTTSTPPAGVGAGTSRPNLFLYSPTSNTMIPCEEIIIPNAVVPGTDVYQGPSNIYLAYPMDTTQSGAGAGGVASTPSPTSTCSPPQAQSPPQPSIVQYDQYGVPFTAYPTASAIVAPNSVSQPNSSPQPGSAGPDSAGSSGESSPPDLSVYHPQNWVQDPQYLANYQQYYQYYPYYYNNRGGSNNGFGYGFQHIESSNVPSSAGDSQNEDDREGRSDNDTTPTTATTTTSNSPKKEAAAGSTKEGGATPNDPKIIPGLNLVKNPTRQTKKRRKKKSSTLQLNTSPSIEAHGGHHRGSSSSEANEKNVLKAITILQRNTEAKKEASEAVEAGTSENSSPPNETFEAELEAEEDKIEAIKEVESELLELENDEEVIHVVVEDFSAEAIEAVEAVEAAKEVENVASIDVIEEQHIECAEAEPEPVPEVLSFKKPHRRRRGARKSERKNKSSQLLATTQVSNEDSSAGPTISGELEAAKAPVKSEVKTSHRHPDDSQWEFVPNDIQDDQEGGWETMKIKNKIGNKIRSGIQTPKESRDSTPVQSNRLVIQDLETSTCTSSSAPQVENHETNSEPDVSSVQTDEQDQQVSSSAPASRKSTLKRKQKKVNKESSDSKTSLKTKPVLISDRDFDVASAAAQRRYHSAFEVLDEEKIKEVAAMTDKRGTFDTLYISDIGHGMGGGPITIGRFGLGKYIPPDRSSEIYPIPMQKNDQDQDSQESSEDLDLKNSESKAQETQKSIIRAMMQEVIKSNNLPQNTLPDSAKAGLTYIRDAERFTELTPAPCASTAVKAEGDTSKSVTIPDAIVNKTKTQELDLD